MGKIQHKKMDAKLRRLVTSIQEESGRLVHDLAHGFITSAGASVPPLDAVKSVLVSLRRTKIPDSFTNLHWVNIAGNIFSVAVPITRLEELASSPQVEYIEAGRHLSPSLITSVPETRADGVHNPGGGAAGLDGQGVIVGIIDFGLDFTLDDFRHPDGSTRMAFLWDQFLTPQASEGAPAGFSHGVEYNEVTINQALNASDPFSIVRHKPATGSHGTHVTGIATSNGRSSDAQFLAGQYIGTAPGATIIFVQPNPTDQNTTFTDSTRVAEAITYIFNKADELGMPCVINTSLAQNGGSHDGESLVERAIDRLLEVPGRAFVVAAGNEHSWRGHASGTLQTNERRTLRWNMGRRIPLSGGGVLQVGDFTSNEMEIWYSSRDQFRLRVTSPDGNATAFVSPGETGFETLPSGDKVFIDSERFTVLNGDARIYIEISPPSSGQLTTGVWQVELEATESRNGRFDAWIERDTRRPQNRFADQSFFVGTDFDAVMTLGTPATTRRGIAVANYDHLTQAPSPSSGRGRTRDGRPKPEVAAPCTNIFSSGALGGRNNPQHNPNSANSAPVFPMRVEMSGTSMSAPHIAGIVALMLQKNGNVSAVQLRQMLIASANAPAGVVPFDIAWGFGRVDAEAAVNLVD